MIPEGEKTDLDVLVERVKSIAFSLNSTQKESQVPEVKETFAVQTALEEELAELSLTM